MSENRKNRTLFLPSHPAFVGYAGIVGNMIDRMVRGYVIDFIDFHWRDAWHFPCFNVADTCITVAAFILVALSFCAAEKEGA